MKEEWLMPGAVVPVDVETTAALVNEIKRLIEVVGGMALAHEATLEKNNLTWVANCQHLAKAEREAIAQMIEDAPALVPFAKNDQGGCMVCGFDPKYAASYIRARGTHEN